MPKAIHLRRITVFSVLILLIIGGVQFWQNGISENEVPNKESERDYIDWYSHNPKSIAYDELGVPHQFIRAKTASHWAVDDRVELTKPRFTQINSSNERWQGASLSGVILGQNELNLRGEVNLYKPISQLNIRTNSMRFDLTTEDFSSQELVTIETPTERTTAIGLDGNATDGRLNLHSQVRSHFAHQ